MDKNKRNCRNYTEEPEKGNDLGKNKRKESYSFPPFSSLQVQSQMSGCG